MDNKAVYKALEEVAKREGIPVETVIIEIESAIKDAYASTHLTRKQIWQEIPCKGEIPTAFEFVRYLYMRTQIQKWLGN